MRKAILILTAQLIFLSSLYSQYSPIDTTTYIFKLKTTEARLILEDYSNMDESYFHSLVDSFSNRRTPLIAQYYSSGHYLQARADGQAVNVSFESVNTISAVVIPNNRDLMIQVYDSLGQSITNAKIVVANKEISYNSKKGGYFKPKWKKEGLVEITTPTETLFYQLEKRDQGWKLLKERFRYFSRRKIGRIVTYPIRLSKSVFYYVRGSIRTKSFSPYYSGNFANRWRTKYQYKGYTATQQPVYQPKDSVKVKAYITNYRGRPLKKELKLKLTSRNNGSQNYFDIPIHPDKNGNYTYTFPLGDSLTLDQDYTLTFYNDKKWQKNSFSQNFRYEDYQLDQVTWAFTQSKDLYHLGESIIFYAEGKDANNNTIPDGQLKLTLLAGRVQKHFDNPSYIPDTLWQKSLALRPRGKTQIMLPDNILPSANMELTMKAELVNSNGETHQEHLTFKVSRNRDRIHAEIRNGIVYAEYLQDGKRKDTTGVVGYWLNDDADTFTEDTIKFPFQQRINPYVYEYDFDTDDAYESISLDEREKEGIRSNVNIVGSWKDGVAEFRFSNPHQIPVYYKLRTKDRVILQDSSSKVSDIIFKKSKYRGAYYIDYSYVWGGKVYEKENTIRPYKKQLSIIINQDSKVRPGNLVQTEIEVRNYKGEAVEGVNLTAGAYNDQFKESNNFSTPQISYKLKRSPFNYTNFSISRPESNYKTLPMNHSFYKKLNLKDHFFHRVRYENTNGITLQYDSLTAPQFGTLAQVSPYIIKDGKEIPAELIYINSKLVYYAGITVKQPYSFLGFDGKNTITIRTRKMEYTLKDIVLKKGHKLEMIIDLKTIWKSEFKDQITSKGVSEKLSIQEKRILNFSLFQYQDRTRYSSKKYIWQKNESVFIIPKNYNNYSFTIGPILPYQSTGFVVQDFFMKKFTPTPGFRYEIFSSQERLYENQIFDPNIDFTIPNHLTYQLIGEVVHTTADIVTQTSKANYMHFDNEDFENKTNQGRYHFRLNRDTSLLAIAITNTQDSLLRLLKPHVSNLNNISAGNYHIYLLKKNGHYSKHSFSIKASHLLYEDLSDLTFQKDTLGAIVTRYTNKPLSIPERKMDPYTAKFFNKKQQAIIGKINTPDSTLHTFNLELYKDDLFVAKTQTDSSGYYQLACYPGIYNLSIQNQDDGSAFNFPVFITDSSLVRLDLIYHQKAYYLNRIEVIGYKKPLIKSDNTTGGLAVTSDEISNLPIRSINSLASISAGVSSSDVNIRGGRTDATVYYIDGVQVKGNLIPDSEISTRAVDLSKTVTGTITDANGNALIGCSVILINEGEMISGTLTDIDGSYMLRVPNDLFELEFSYIGFNTQRIQDINPGSQIDVVLEDGVELSEVVVVTGYSKSKYQSLTLSKESTDESTPALEGGIQLRSDFKDYAYWQPNLITDKDGKASFQTVFPDKITSWRTFVIGMNKKLQAGIAYANTQSFKPLVAQLVTPRFLIAGDQSTIIGKCVNYTSDSYPVETKFSQDGVLLQSNTFDIKEAQIESAEINAPSDVDSLNIIYELLTGEYGDGEKQQIPIFENGIEETLGGFYLLEGDTTLQLEFDKQSGPITLYAQSDVLSLMLNDLKYLTDYPYSCNEQTASRLIGFMLKKQVKKQLNQSFEDEDEIIKMIVRLKKTQNEDGSWGWWANNPQSQWITIHVLKALAKAKESGYTTTAFDKGIRYVTNFLPGASSRNKIEILELLSSINQRTTYDTYLTEMDSLSLPLKEQYTIIKIKQEQNLAYELDSLDAYRRTNIFGGEYWGHSTMSIMSEDVDLSLLAYQIYRNEGEQKHIRPLRQFFMMRRSALSQSYGHRFGRNTYETANILAELLPDLLNQTKGSKITANELIIKGNSTQTISQFPFKQVLTGEKSLHIKKKGTGTLYLTAYQQFINTAPTPKRELFDITSKLVQNKKAVKKLKQGERVQLIIDVEVTKDVEYAMINIPIPAACSYYNKTNSRNDVEVHREYFRNKTAIFCRNLPQGNHQFTIDLEARFAGNYSLLPTKVEQMYFPIFYGRNEIKKVRVEE